MLHCFSTCQLELATPLLHALPRYQGNSAETRLDQLKTFYVPADLWTHAIVTGQRVRYAVDDESQKRTFWLREFQQFQSAYL